MHEHTPGEVRCTQDDYVKQLRVIPIEHGGGLDEAVGEQVKASFWSLLGAAAWVLMTRGDVAVYVGSLQRNQQSPTWKHISHLNSVVRWMRRKSCVLICRPVPFPWQVTAFPDSALRAQEPDCLAIRAAVILITCVGFFPKGGKAGVLEFYSRKETKVCRSTFSVELASVDDGVSHSFADARHG